MNRGFVRVRLLTGIIGLGLCVIGGRGLLAQQAPVPALPPPINLSDDPNLRPFVWRSIGPANMGGRVDDIAAVESNPSIIYVGFATGGIWKSTNNGTTWTPIFDRYPVSSIGDIAIAPSNPDIIYVGTGEANNRQSSSFGGGVYKSVDAGKTFEYVGLKETQSIGRVVVHPHDPNIAYVAAAGHLFGPNPERGLFKTTDGGKTWTNTNFIDNDTGFTDVAMDASNPNILFAASYQRRRTPWGFNGGGPGSGLWKTTDGGKKWTRLSGSGLPDNPMIGRIGLDISRSKPNTIYASFEVGPSGGTGAGVNDDGTLSRRADAAATPRGPVAAAAATPTPPRSHPIRRRAACGGRTMAARRGAAWRTRAIAGCTTARSASTRPTRRSRIRVGPRSSRPSTAAGRWRQVQGIPHSDHHAIWIDPHNGNHLLLGNDGGLDVTYDQAETWEYVNTVPVGQFYAISADMRKPYVVCGGLQDNGSWCGPSATRTH